MFIENKSTSRYIIDILSIYIVTGNQYGADTSHIPTNHDRKLLR